MFKPNVDAYRTARMGRWLFKFVLDTTQATAISSFICTSAVVTGCAGVANPANANNRIGVAAILTNSQGGAETFSIGEVAGQ